MIIEGYYIHTHAELHDCRFLYERALDKSMPRGDDFVWMESNTRAFKLSNIRTRGVFH